VKLGLKKGNASPTRRVTPSQAARAAHAAVQARCSTRLPRMRALRFVHKLSMRTRIICTRAHFILTPALFNGPGTGHPRRPPGRSCRRLCQAVRRRV